MIFLNSKMPGFISILFLILGCSPPSPQPADLVGSYKVSFELDTKHSLPSGQDDWLDMDSVELKFSETFSALNEEINQETDTSTAEGKIVYAAKMFGKTMQALGDEMEGLGEKLGGIGKNLASDLQSWKHLLLDEIELEVELQQDGDIKLKNSTLDLLSIRDAKWEVRKDSFYLIQDNTKSNVFWIKKRNPDEVILEKDDLLVVLKKQIKKE